MNRREFLRTGLLAGGSTVLVTNAVLKAYGKRDFVKLVECADTGQRKGIVEVEKVEKPDAEWKKQLTPEQFEVTRRAGTERAFANKYWNNLEHGLYKCICCGNALFS